MTKKELSKLYYLKKDILETEEKIKRLEELTTKTTSNLQSTIVKGGVSDKSVLVAQILDLKNLLYKKQDEKLHQYDKTIRYIEEIDDPLTRLIFTYRFIDGFSWGKVARKVGGYNTRESVKKICYRYIKGLPC